MPQPALEKNYVAGFGWIRDVHLILAARGREPWRRGHEAIEPRILELQSGTSAWRDDVVRAADERQRMQMQRVGRGWRHDVHPQISQPDRSPAQVHVERAGERANVRREFSLELAKRAGKTMQLVHRGVARVAAGIILLRPASPGGIKFAELSA